MKGSPDANMRLLDFYEGGGGCKSLWGWLEISCSEGGYKGE